MWALRTMAITTPAIFGLVQDRVYVNEIPLSIVRAEDTRRPRKMLVLRQAGGGGKADLMPVFNYTIDALAYGEDDLEANKLLLAVTERFITLSRETHNNVLIHHLNTTGGPIPSVEPDLVWPVIAQSFTTLADVLEVA